MDDFTDWFVRLRKSKGFRRQSDLAQKTGLSPTTIGQIERGKMRGKRDAVLHLVADRLGTSADEIRARAMGTWTEARARGVPDKVQLLGAVKLRLAQVLKIIEQIEELEGVNPRPEWTVDESTMPNAEPDSRPLRELPKGSGGKSR